jgi:hypothetical protein
MERRIFVTEHTGLLFRDKNGFTYFEKAGGSGPFVLLEFEDEAALVSWYEGAVTDGSKWGYTHHFMTLNDKKIRKLKPRPVGGQLPSGTTPSTAPENAPSGSLYQDND